MKLTKTNLFLRSALAVMGAFVALVGYQFYEVAGEVKSARISGLSAWAAQDPEKEKIVETFTAACLGNTSPPGAPMATYECGEKYGSPELVAVLKIADDSVVAPAPLRWL